MKTVSINVMNLCVPCANRCRYCLLSYDGRLSGVDYKRSEDYTKRFSGWIRENRPDLDFLFGFGYSMDHPQLLETIDFLNSIDSPTGQFLQFDGMRFRDEQELDELLRGIQRHGVKLIDLTFYGTREYHDRFAARKGDYEYMMTILKLANQIGLDVEVGIALSHENVGQIDGLMDELETYKLKRIFCFVPHAEGRGVSLNKVRFSQDDYVQLSERAKEHFNTNRYMPECRWVKLIEKLSTETLKRERTQSGDQSTEHELTRIRELLRLEKRVLTVVLTAENVDQFEQMSFADTISYLEKLDDDYYRIMPTVEELMGLYGDPEGDKYYSLRDLYLNYQRRYIRENNLEIYDINDERQCFSRRF